MTLSFVFTLNVIPLIASSALPNDRTREKFDLTNQRRVGRYSTYSKIEENCSPMTARTSSVHDSSVLSLVTRRQNSPPSWLRGASHLGSISSRIKWKQVLCDILFNEGRLLKHFQNF